MAQAKRPAILANLVLVAFSIFLSLLLLGGLELGLRVSSIGEDRRTSRLKYQQIHFPTLVPGERADGTPVLRPADPRLRYQSVLRDKPEGALRVVTFGGSATAGLGFSPNVTFSRELERALRAAYPGRHIEVLNLGIVALASKQVKLLVDEVARLHDADAMVVYSGNNEFLEVHAQKYAEATSTPLSRVGTALMDLNLYRFVNEMIRGRQRGAAAATCRRIGWRNCLARLLRAGARPWKAPWRCSVNTLLAVPQRSAMSGSSSARGCTRRWEISMRPGTTIGRR